MEVNNFETIKNLLTFNSDDEFYIIELIKRRKDNPTMNKSEKLIDVFELSNSDDINKYENIIKDICVRNNCRAYIRLNKRSRKHIALQMMKELSIRICNNNYHVKNLYHSTCGKYHKDSNKTFIIDIDKDDINNIDNVITKYIHIQNKCNNGNFLYKIPTLNGVHLIVSPFNTKEFSDSFPNIDVHKDNPTVLYCNII